MKKNILFVTGTRADFGKVKGLIRIVDNHDEFEAKIFVTGMHMLSKYGLTANEVDSCSFGSVYKFINQNANDSMDVILAKTVLGLSDYVAEVRPDLIVVHGDRVEALAGAVVGSLNCILVSHIEGGEVSGTIDELIRHSVSKMAHIHFVANISAKQRLLQLGEQEEAIFVIGSPDLDVMFSQDLPSIDEAKKRYEIDFEEYGVFVYHPVTTELDELGNKIRRVADALESSGRNFVVIYPNNDHGSDLIMSEIARLESRRTFRIFPSIRFEHFLTLLRHSKFMIGNSSAGVREAPYYGIPSINLGTRQLNRSKAKSIIHCDEDVDQILDAISDAEKSLFKPEKEFGDGNSHHLFLRALEDISLWKLSKQKVFVDR